MTTTVEQPKQQKQGEKVRVLGTIIVEPEQKTSKNGNLYTSLVVATSNGLGKEKDVIWNITVMKQLRDKLPQDLFKKFSYAKFNGLGSQRDWVSNKDPNKKGTSNDMLCDSVTLPDGTIVYQNDKKEDGGNGSEPF